MSIGAAFVQRVSGFGFGIFIMTVLPFLMPSYGEATTLSGLLASVTSIIVVVKNYKHLKWRKLLPILITFLIVSLFAVMFVSMAAGGVLKTALGIILILSSIWFLFLADKVKLPPTMPVQISMGSLSGLMGGFFAMQGPPAVLYFISSSESKEEYMATAQMYFVVGNVMMTVYRAYHGFLTMNVAQCWCIGLIAVLIGTTLGNLVFKKVSMQILRTIIYVYMAISGVICLVS